MYWKRCFRGTGNQKARKGKETTRLERWCSGVGDKPVCLQIGPRPIGGMPSVGGLSKIWSEETANAVKEKLRTYLIPCYRVQKYLDSRNLASCVTNIFRIFGNNKCQFKRLLYITNAAFVKSLGCADCNLNTWYTRCFKNKIIHWDEFTANRRRADE